MTASFTYMGAPHRAILGAGLSSLLAEELKKLGVNAPFLVSTAGQATRADAYLAGVATAGHFPGAEMHTPVAVTLRAIDALRAKPSDSIISFGGGSATGLGKALALRTGLPLIAIGTTYGGSEMTAALGETENGVKVTKRDPRVLPKVTIYDVELTLDLPIAITAASGLNAMAHAVEAVYAPDANPVITPIALDAIRSLSVALPRLIEAPTDLDARTDALRGAFQAGLCLNAVSMGLHHKLCHTLGGTFNLPHAQTHAIVLPHAVAYNEPATPDASAAIAKALGANGAASGLYALVSRVAPVPSLRALGMPEDGIDHAADLAVGNPYSNVRPIERTAIRALIARAWAGSPPA